MRKKRGIRSIALLIALLMVAWPGFLSAQSTAAGLIQQARSLAAANQLQQANEALSEALRQEPDNMTAWQALGEVQLAQMLYSDAMTSFESVLTHEPDSVPAQNGSKCAPRLPIPSLRLQMQAIRTRSAQLFVPIARQKICAQVSRAVDGLWSPGRQHADLSGCG